MKRILRWILIAFVILLFVVVGGFVLYARLSTAAPQPEALAAMRSTDEVEVVTDKWLVFHPRGSTPNAGLIFYPGGLVDPQAYAPMARDIAARGFLVVIVPMPLNLAVLGSGKATGVIESFPEIESWAIGGHSLGGAMASQYAHRTPKSVSGLVLWAAFPPDSSDLSASTLTARSIYGTRDGLVSIGEIEESRRLLPVDTEFVPIEGGNHAQFGWYGLQKRDLPATISHADQQAQAVAGTISLLDRLE